MCRLQELRCSFMKAFTALAIQKNPAQLMLDRAGSKKKPGGIFI
jgi:hypothetical protein